MNFFTMNKRLTLENPHGYSIEVGKTSYDTSLEERIQAAKIASLNSQQRHKQNSTRKVSLINSRSENGINSQNVTVKKSINSAHDFYRKTRCLEPVSNKLKPTSSVVPSNLTQNKNTNLHNLNNCGLISSLKPELKPNIKGSMQQRLEAIKNNKNLSSTILHPSDSILGSTKHSNTSSTNISFEDAHSKILNSCQSNSSFSQRHEYYTRSTVQKTSYEPSTFFGHCDRTRNITNTSKNAVSSVQERLIKAKEEIKVKSKFPIQYVVTKTETFQKPHHVDLYSIYQDSSLMCKAKRVGSTSSIKRSKLTTISKPCVSNNLGIKNVKQQPNIVQQKPTILNNNINSSDVSTNMPSQDILKKSQQKELNNFSFVSSQTPSVQERLKIHKKEQCNNDDSMEWEDVEPENIVNKVNDFRKSKVEFEPMEWTPETIMHSDQTNLCLVIDTNILLSNLKPISMIIDKVIPDFGYPTIALPWQVLQELDYLKKGDNAIGFRAREAARWLLSVLSISHPRVKGQPMTLKSSKNPDDAILECALNVKERVNVVYLVTDDKMLQIKAEFNGLTPKNSSWILNLVIKQKQYNTFKPSFKDVIAMYPNIDNQLLLKCIPHLEHIISRILRFAVKHNQELSSFGKKTWWKMYSLTLPLNLTKCLLKLKEHWHIIAPQKMLKRPQKQVEWLVYFLKELQETPACEFSWHEIYLFMEYCSELVNYLPFEYYGITDFFLNDLMAARKLLRTKTSHSNSTLDDSSLLANLSNNLNVSIHNTCNIDNIMLNILKKVETFCSNVYEASGIQHDLYQNELKCMHSKNMYSSYNVDGFSNTLSNLIKNMLKIKKMSTEQILNNDIIMDEFSKSIVALDSDCAELSRDHLIDFCLMKDQNVFLSVLLSFQNKLSALKNLTTTMNL